MLITIAIIQLKIIKILTLIINEKELRNETRDKSSKIENLMMNLSKDRNLKNLVVTRGSNGSILYSRKKNNFIMRMLMQQIS